MQKNWWELSPEQEAELQEKLAKVGKSHKKRPKTHEEVLEEIADGYKDLYSGPDQTIRIENRTTDLDIIRQAAFEEGNDVRMDIKVTVTEPTKRNSSPSSMPFKTDNMVEVARTNSDSFKADPFISGRFDVIAVLPPKRKNQYRRTLATVKSLGLQVKYLNPKIKVSVLDDFMGHVLIQYSSFVPETWIDHKNTILAEVMKTAHKEIEPMTTKIKTLWNPDYDLTVSERRGILQEYRQKAKKNKTLQALKVIYRTDMTQKQLAEASSRSLPTIKRYWKQLQAA
ncbi:hypothetical protein V1387_12795 [Allomuricauda taeanensis]|nr:hypothetical protein [Allomuricauda taeanensis]